MPSKFTYLLIDTGSILLPLIFSFHHKIKFNKQWKAFWLSNLITSIAFLLWDSYFTKIGVWGFNENYTLGVNFFGLPFEEILFFICIPYSSIFTYHCLTLFYPHFQKFNSRNASILLIVLLVLACIFSFDKLYTFVTGIFLAMLIFYISFIVKAKWLSVFYIMYLIILLPFFLVNGILTGTGIDAPIVWYNNLENFNLRIITIPIEDVFYGMLLLLLNTYLFEKFRNETPVKFFGLAHSD